jgi:hypothetical protein
MVTPTRAPAADPEVDPDLSAVLVLDPQAAKPTARPRLTATVANFAIFILLLIGRVVEIDVSR